MPELTARHLLVTLHLKIKRRPLRPEPRSTVACWFAVMTAQLVESLAPFVFRNLVFRNLAFWRNVKEPCGGENEQNRFDNSFRADSGMLQCTSGDRKRHSSREDRLLARCVTALQKPIGRWRQRCPAVSPAKPRTTQPIMPEGFSGPRNVTTLLFHSGIERAAGIKPHRALGHQRHLTKAGASSRAGDSSQLPQWLCWRERPCPSRPAATLP